MRTGVYFDGFNLYHAIDALDEPQLKWLDLHSLATSYVNKGDSLDRVVFFSALSTWDKGKRQRHIQYVDALQYLGVDIVLSRFEKVRKRCHSYDRWCHLREEKQTDVAMSVTMLLDCYELGIERIVLVTADSDQIPVVSALKRRFPNVIVFLVAPPDRLQIARQLGAICDGVSELRPGRIRSHLLPETIRDGGGKLIAAMPKSYGPSR